MHPTEMSRLEGIITDAYQDYYKRDELATRSMVKKVHDSIIKHG